MHTQLFKIALKCGFLLPSDLIALPVNTLVPYDHKQKQDEIVNSLGVHMMPAQSVTSINAVFDPAFALASLSL